MVKPEVQKKIDNGAAAPSLAGLFSADTMGAVKQEEAVRSPLPGMHYELEVRNLNVWYGSFLALRNVNVGIANNKITALIGPSGCGKSTMIRCLNRMNDLIPSFRAEGEVLFQDTNLYDKSVDPVSVRQRIGMVFQKPNPFPKSIYENIAFGVRVNGIQGRMDEIVEKTLIRAALWDDVKDKLHQSALALSGGQQQRLCIARALAVEPEVILMDEPCSALDPIATLRIEDLMHELASEYTIAIVTHNMQQAARASDYTTFFLNGEVVEYGATDLLFTSPKNKRTEDYITGRFG